MLNIIGVGCAYPDTVIHDEELFAYASSKEVYSGVPAGKVKARRSVLPQAYLSETGNRDPFDSVPKLLDTPTTLGAKAFADALKCANLQIEQIGFIAGDSSTPLETAPSEGQRIAGAAGTKGPAYDITGASCALSLHLDVFSKWKDERLPDYIASTSANAATMNIDYSSRSEGFWFGDAASVVIVSPRIKGKLKVADKSFKTLPALPDFLTVDLYKHLQMGERPSADIVNGFFKQSVDSIKKLPGFSAEEVKVIAPPLFSEQAAEYLTKNGFSANNFWSNCEFLGDSLGSYSACVLSQHWAELDSESQVLVLQIGAGVSFGHIFLQG